MELDLLLLILVAKLPHFLLSLYLSYFSCIGTFESINMSDGSEEFDVRSEKDLWNEIKRGLVLDPKFPPLLVDLSLSNSN